MSAWGGKRTLATAHVGHYDLIVFDRFEEGVEPSADTILDEVLGLIHSVGNQPLGILRKGKNLATRHAELATPMSAFHPLRTVGMTCANSFGPRHTKYDRP